VHDGGEGGRGVVGDRARNAVGADAEHDAVEDDHLAVERVEGAEAEVALAPQLADGELSFEDADVQGPKRRCLKEGAPLPVGASSFATFSTFTVEMRHLLATTHWSMADAYALTSLVAGLVAVWTGIAVARRATGLPVRRGPSRRDQTPSAPPPARLPASPGDPPRKGSSR